MEDWHDYTVVGDVETLVHRSEACLLRMWLAFAAGAALPEATLAHPVSGALYRLTLWDAETCGLGGADSCGHPLSREEAAATAFGLKRFVYVTAQHATSDLLGDIPRATARLLLSAVGIASANLAHMQADAERQAAARPAQAVAAPLRPIAGDASGGDAATAGSLPLELLSPASAAEDEAPATPAAGAATGSIAAEADAEGRISDTPALAPVAPPAPSAAPASADSTASPAASDADTAWAVAPASSSTPQPPPAAFATTPLPVVVSVHEPSRGACIMMAQAPVETVHEALHRPVAAAGGAGSAPGTPSATVARAHRRIGTLRGRMDAFSPWEGRQRLLTRPGAFKREFDAAAAASLGDQLGDATVAETHSLPLVSTAHGSYAWSIPTILPAVPHEQVAGHQCAPAAGAAAAAHAPSTAIVPSARDWPVELMRSLCTQTAAVPAAAASGFRVSALFPLRCCMVTTRNRTSVKAAAGKPSSAGTTKAAESPAIDSPSPTPPDGTTASEAADSAESGTAAGKSSAPVADGRSPTDADAAPTRTSTASGAVTSADAADLFTTTSVDWAPMPFTSVLVGARFRDTTTVSALLDRGAGEAIPTADDLLAAVTAGSRGATGDCTAASGSANGDGGISVRVQWLLSSFARSTAMHNALTSSSGSSAPRLSGTLWNALLDADAATRLAPHPEAAVSPPTQPLSCSAGHPSVPLPLALHVGALHAVARGAQLLPGLVVELLLQHGLASDAAAAGAFADVRLQLLEAATTFTTAAAFGALLRRVHDGDGFALAGSAGSSDASDSAAVHPLVTLLDGQRSAHGQPAILRIPQHFKTAPFARMWRSFHKAFCDAPLTERVTVDISSRSSERIADAAVSALSQCWLRLLAVSTPAAASAAIDVASHSAADRSTATTWQHVFAAATDYTRFVDPATLGQAAIKTAESVAASTHAAVRNRAASGPCSPLTVLLASELSRVLVAAVTGSEDLRFLCKLAHANTATLAVLAHNALRVSASTPLEVPMPADSAAHSLLDTALYAIACAWWSLMTAALRTALESRTVGPCCMARPHVPSTEALWQQDQLSQHLCLLAVAADCSSTDAAWNPSAGSGSGTAATLSTSLDDEVSVLGGGCSGGGGGGGSLAPAVKIVGGAATEASSGVFVVDDGASVALPPTVNPPALQAFPLVTRDQATAAAHVLAQVGLQCGDLQPGAHVAGLRPSTAGHEPFMHAVIRSDMICFKASNPRACIVDFLRWYYPHEWTPAAPAGGPSVFGSLSERLGGFVVAAAPPVASSSTAAQAPSAVVRRFWADLWAASTPLSASLQRPLFNPLLAAEMATSWLQTAPASAVFADLLAAAVSTSAAQATAAANVAVAAAGCECRVAAVLKDLTAGLTSPVSAPTGTGLVPSTMRQLCAASYDATVLQDALQRQISGALVAQLKFASGAAAGATSGAGDGDNSAHAAAAREAAIMQAVDVATALVAQSNQSAASALEASAAALDVVADVHELSWRTVALAAVFAVGGQPAAPSGIGALLDTIMLTSDASQRSSALRRASPVPEAWSPASTSASSSTAVAAPVVTVFRPGCERGEYSSDLIPSGNAVESSVGDMLASLLRGTAETRVPLTLVPKSTHSGTTAGRTVRGAGGAIGIGPLPTLHRGGTIPHAVFLQAEEALRDGKAVVFRGGHEATSPAADASSTWSPAHFTTAAHNDDDNTTGFVGPLPRPLSAVEVHGAIRSAFASVPLAAAAPGAHDAGVASCDQVAVARIESAVAAAPVAALFRVLDGTDALRPVFSQWSFWCRDPCNDGTGVHVANVDSRCTLTADAVGQVTVSQVTAQL